MVADNWALKWFDPWFLIAYDLATDYALGQNFETRAGQNKVIKEMSASLSFIDFTLATA